MYKAGLLIALLMMPFSAYAAEYRFSGSTRVGVGEQRTIDVFVDTQGQVVNALEGQVVLEGSAARIVDVYRGGSILSFWLNDTTQTSEAVPFVGIVPNGFSGTGFLMTLVLEGAAEGESVLDFTDLRTLLHDGYGTETGSTGIDAVVQVREGIEGETIVYTDQLPPEWFEPAIIKDTDVFDGQYALVFATNDKGFGVSHYEVQESRDGELHPDEWVQTQSPYLLQDQSRRSTVFVKAVDSAGNIRIVAISEGGFARAVWLYWLLPLMAFVIILLLIRLHRAHLKKDGTLSTYDGEEE